MTFQPLILVSHPLCPYVQRAAIAMTEKHVSFERRDIDLANKPDWFRALSPLGKTPVLLVGAQPIFESVAILEYLEETQPHPLHPQDPLERADHRAWMEFGSAVLNDIAGLYNAPDEQAIDMRADALAQKCARLDNRLSATPFFAGEHLSLVDAVFGPVFRYFDVFDNIGDFGVMTDREKLRDWREALATRPSIAKAVSSDYNDRLRRFLRARGSHLSTMMGRA